MTDLLDAKISLEASGLLSDAASSRVFVDALEADNSWLSESALRACRNLKVIDGKLETLLTRYLSEIRMTEVIRRSNEIRFSLSLSDGFRRVRRFWQLRSLDARLLLVGLALCLVLSPIAGAFGLLCFLYLPTVGLGRKNFVESFWRLSTCFLLMSPVLALHRGNGNGQLRALLHAGGYYLGPILAFSEEHHRRATTILVLGLLVLVSPVLQLFYMTRIHGFQRLLGLTMSLIFAFSGGILEHFYPRAIHLFMLWLGALLGASTTLVLAISCL